jgi:hypothetical protein
VPDSVFRQLDFAQSGGLSAKRGFSNHWKHFFQSLEKLPMPAADPIQPLLGSEDGPAARRLILRDLRKTPGSHRLLDGLALVGSKRDALRLLFRLPPLQLLLWFILRPPPAGTFLQLRKNRHFPLFSPTPATMKKSFLFLPQGTQPTRHPSPATHLSFP